MIVDVHSHAWDQAKHFTGEIAECFRGARPDQQVDLTVRLNDYRAKATARGETVKTIVFGGKAKRAGLWVPDSYVAEYVQQDPENLIGFMSLDPTQPGWREEMEHGRENLGLRGIKIMPMYAGFDPRDEEIKDLWDYASKHSLPVLLHTGTNTLASSPLRFTQPELLDDVAIEFPDAKIILAHMSHPYFGGCIATIRKQPNVYADISALHYRPKQFYDALVAVQEYGVWEKLLFGTDFPFTTVDDTINDLNSLNNLVEGTNLPRLNEEEITKMIHRDSLEILGLN